MNVATEQKVLHIGFFQVVNLVTSEFIQQGDIEREQLNENEIPVIIDCLTIISPNAWFTRATQAQA